MKTVNNPIQCAREVIDIEVEALNATRARIGDAFVAAVNLLRHCLDRNGKIVVTGIGKSLNIAGKISATLASTGSPSVVLNPSQAMHGDLGILRPEDVLLVLSCSGESDELLTLVPPVRRLGIKIVSITREPNSRLAGFSDVVTPIGVPREACPFNLAPTASTTATLALGDALAMALLDSRGFQLDDYARLHPGGAIGRALLYKVSDIMRTGKRLATVLPETPIRDTLLAMTRARCGSACVTDKDGFLRGIFTDGDLRRRLADGKLDMDMRVEEGMTPDPVRIEAEQLAVNALRLFESHKIDDLPVVDKTGRLVGSVDIQDLPRFKVM